MQTYASTVELSGVARVRHDVVFDLYRPAGTPRLRLIAAGRYVDHWLAPRGAITVWPRTGGTLELVLQMPRGTQVTPIHLTGKGIDRMVRVHPGERIPLRFSVPAGGPWSLHFSSTKQGYLGDRAVTVLAPVVRFR